MKEQEQQILKKIFKKVTETWSEPNAIAYVPILFSFVEPKEPIREALKALNCKKEKEERLEVIIRSQEKDYHFFMREIKDLLGPDESRIDSKTVLIILSLMLALRGNNINLDINQLHQSLYSECDKCTIREICKEAFPLLSEYVYHALKELNFQIVDME